MKLDYRCPPAFRLPQNYCKPLAIRILGAPPHEITLECSVWDRSAGFFAAAKVGQQKSAAKETRSDKPRPAGAHGGKSRLDRIAGAYSNQLDCRSGDDQFARAEPLAAFGSMLNQTLHRAQWASHDF